MILSHNDKQLKLSLPDLEIVFPLSGKKIKAPLIYDKKSNGLLAKSLYLLKIKTQESSQKINYFNNHQIKQFSKDNLLIELKHSIKDKMSFKMSFIFDKAQEDKIKMTIEANVSDRFSDTFSLRFLAFIPGSPTRHVRLTAGLYSGWTIDGKTFAVLPDYAVSPPEIAILTPQKDVNVGHGELKKDGKVRCIPICFSYPPALDNCLVNRWDERNMSGSFSIVTSNLHICNPELLQSVNAKKNANSDIRPGRYPIQRYLDQYLEFLDHPEMFIEFGDKFGLYHRGFFNCSNEGSFRKELGKDGNEKQYAGALMYRSPAMREHQANPDKYPNMRIFGPCANMREPLCDIVWGGAHNLQTAHFLLRQNKLVDKAEKILYTLLHYRNKQGKGFQLDSGKSKGAWWNAYQPEIDKFSSRYFEPLIGVGDQGLWAHYLYSITREKLFADDAIAEQIIRNCKYYLEPLYNSTCILFHSLTLNKRAGYIRERKKYNSVSPFASIMMALGFLSTYRVSGERHWKELAKAQTRKCIEKFYRNFDWGWQEYDTMGQDTMGMGRTLMALCELYQELPFPELHESAENLMNYLYNCQHHIDLSLKRYMNTGQVWGGTAENYGGFIHGYTYNSNQGLQTLTFRSDIPEGILAYYNTFGGAKAYESLVKYYNLLTFHQVIRHDIPFGVGSSSEHLNLKADYVQDTFQVANAMPWGIEEICRVLHLHSTNSELTKIELKRNELHLVFAPTPELKFSVMHPKSKCFEVFLGENLLLQSFDGHIAVSNYNGENIIVKTRIV